jgi:hypothetical protein
MSTTVKDYTFYNLDRIEDDSTCESQRSMQNTRYSNYITTNLFNGYPSDSQIQFATSQPAVFPNSSFLGSGIGSSNVDVDSNLLIKSEQERSLGRLNLMQRPFVAVPYLGRGSCDPTLESQLLQGELITDKKSVTTVMSQSFMGYTLYPTNDEMEDRVKNTKNTVEESAMDGWVRGGSATREISNDSYLSTNNRPTNSSY